jgi:hypothetical protein
LRTFASWRGISDDNSVTNHLQQFCLARTLA